MSPVRISSHEAGSSLPPLTQRARQASSSGSDPAARSARAFMPEIQVLRAVAVMLVVCYHYWPNSLTGGYVGVDAFFVISGYLITAHLFREVDRTGSLSLWAFYARRVRRLLPASLLVLLFVAVGTFVFLPTGLWIATAQELTASGFSVQNLWLASRAVTYSASNAVASPVEHYWSLSTEEQFYLVWPGLIIISCLVARKWLRGKTTTTVGFTLLLVTISSFAYSVWATQAYRAAAYFITPTRAWEFGAGGLVVLLLRRWAPPLRLARILRWAGIIGLLAAAWCFSATTAFPGYAAALPVISTAAIIIAGDTGRTDPSDLIVRARPVQWLGDVSYSLYLWHWPLLVFAPYALGHMLNTPQLLVLLLISLVVAGLSKRFVENGTQYWPRLVRSPRATLSAAVVGVSVIALIAGTQVYAGEAYGRKTTTMLADVSSNPCFGAQGITNNARCPNPFAQLPLYPITKSDAPWAPVQGCRGSTDEVPAYWTCFWGRGRPSRLIALVGDSHAEQWNGALDRIAKAKNWEVIQMSSNGCAASDALSVVFEHKVRTGDGCNIWTNQATAKLRTLAPDDIITSAFVQENVFSPAGSGPAGFEEVWKQWLTFSRVSVLRDIPTAAGRNDPQCVAINVGKPQACANPRSQVLVDDDMVRAARAMGSAVNLIDLSDYFCDATRCYAVVGGANVYFDYDHMSRQFSTTLASALLQHLPKT
jgi:peptidoglycan/LPS O-acetylase OafA/YrhL